MTSAPLASAGAEVVAHAVRLQRQDCQFLLGSADLSYSELASHPGHPRLWRRIITDTPGLEHVAATLPGWPHGQSPASYQVAAFHLGAGELELQVDLVSELAHAHIDAAHLDLRYEESTDRWRKHPHRDTGFVAADAGSIRNRLLNPTLFEPATYEHLPPYARFNRMMLGTAAAMAYLGTCYFVPAPVADQLAGRPPLTAAARRRLRQPARYQMVFHDGLPVRELARRNALPAEGGLIGGEHSIIGALLTATADARTPGDDRYGLDEEIGFLLVAFNAPGQTAIQAVAATFGDHPAGHLLYQYAALLAFEGWSAPPPAPPQPHGRATRSWLKRLARSEQGRDGAFHQVRTLPHRPPPSAPAPRDPVRTGTGKPLSYRHNRRPHTKPHVRVGIRDERGRLVGPVYGPDAIEGVTFHRVEKRIGQTTVRPDLPEKPGPSPVRTVPRTLTSTTPQGGDRRPQRRGGPNATEDR